MYLNGTGIRAIGRVLGASPAAVLHATLQQRPAQVEPEQSAPPDIIELDEIYTYIQKNSAAP